MERHYSMRYVCPRECDQRRCRIRRVRWLSIGHVLEFGWHAVCEVRRWTLSMRVSCERFIVLCLYARKLDIQWQLPVHTVRTKHVLARIRRGGVCGMPEWHVQRRGSDAVCAVCIAYCRTAIGVWWDMGELDELHRGRQQLYRGTVSGV